jgi:hypothetical protein
VAAEQRGDVDLQQRAGLDRRAQPPQPVLEQAGGAFGMRDQQPEAVAAHVAPGRQERRVDPAEGHLEQHPPRAARPVGDRVELRVAEPGGAAREDLAARLQAEADARRVERGLQRPCARRDRRHVERVVGVTDVRRRRGLVNAVAREPRGVLECRGLVRRPVVDAGKQVQVQVDMHRLRGSRRSVTTA